jgi:hypothetical protein
MHLRRELIGAGYLAPGHAEFDFAVEQLSVKLKGFFTLPVKVEMWNDVHPVSLII